MALKPSLADRLRAVVGTSAVPRVHPDALADGLAHRHAPPASDATTGLPDEGSTTAGASRLGDLGSPTAGVRIDRVRRAADVLGGSVDERPDGLCIVVERHYPADARHGVYRVGDIVDMLRRAEDGLALLRRAWPAAARSGTTSESRGRRDATPAVDGAQPPSPALTVDGLCAIDLETTGLAGGAGTQAFLVGCARIEGEGLVVRQFLSPGFEWERAQLAALADWMRDRTHLITFNGRTFDVPLLEMRFAFNRIPWPWANVPHVDALHPARRFWRDRPELVAPDPDEASCSLGVLERRLAGVHRVGDVPGFEIPARFFQFARDGRAEPLEAVLEHNRLDLVSTLLVSARASRLVVGGPSSVEHGHECLGLGRIYERLDDHPSAESCYARAAAQALGMRDGTLRAEALRRLAYVQRRSGRTAEAAASWTAVLATRGAPVRLRREAREALAIHQEHRAGDLAGARALVLDALAEPVDERQRSRAEYRLARLDRKLQRRLPGTLIERLDADN
jgi:uncharacterized protein